MAAMRPCGSGGARILVSWASTRRYTVSATNPKFRAIQRKKARCRCDTGPSSCLHTWVWPSVTGAMGIADYPRRARNNPSLCIPGSNWAVTKPLESPNSKELLQADPAATATGSRLFNHLDATECRLVRREFAKTVRVRPANRQDASYLSRTVRSHHDRVHAFFPRHTNNLTRRFSHHKLMFARDIVSRRNDLVEHRHHRFAVPLSKLPDARCSMNGRQRIARFGFRLEGCDIERDHDSLRIARQDGRSDARSRSCESGVRRLPSEFLCFTTMPTPTVPLKS